MDLMQMGAQLLNEKLGLNVDNQTIQAALSSLAGDGKGGLDFGSIVEQMGSNLDLGALASSWLGDGGNLPISADSIQNIFGQDKINEFASQLGTQPAAASEGLADMLPQLMDKASSGGSLLDAAGGVDGLLGAAKSFLS